MKKIFSVICIVLCVTVAFSSCVFDTNAKIIEKVNGYLSEGDYNECSLYLDSLKDEKISELNGELCQAVIEKFTELSKQAETENIYDISSYTSDFTEECRSLWNISSKLSIENDAQYTADFINLRFYSLVCELNQYREVYALIKDVNGDGYIKQIDNAVYAFENNLESIDFDSAYASASGYDYSGFDPEQYLVSDFRSAHDLLVESLYSAANAFSISDAESAGKAISDIKEHMSSVLYIYDMVTAVHSLLLNTYSALNTENGLKAEYNMEISVDKREYTPGIGFDLNYIFGSASELIDEPQDNGDSQESDISAAEALRTAVNAVNSTKSYTGNITVKLTQQQNNQLTDFKTDTKIDSAVEITKSRLNDMLESLNGTGKSEHDFKNGTDGSISLYDFVPPYAKTADCDSSAISSYSVKKGSAGTVITFEFKETETGTGKPQNPLMSLINGFSLDGNESVSEYNTYYSPSSVMLVINGNGLLSQYQYSITGLSNCRFTEGGEETADVTFSFSSKYLYEFVY